MKLLDRLKTWWQRPWRSEEALHPDHRPVARREDTRRGEDLSDEDVDGEVGWRLIRLFVGALLLLAAGLIFNAVGVPGAAVGALAGIVLLMGVMYGGPLLAWLWRRSWP